MSYPLLRILLVDDDADDFLITSDLLNDISMVRTELLWRDNLPAGLEALRLEKPDVVLVDYRLGSDSGLDFIEQAQNRGITTPTILLTGHGDNELDARAMELGAADYLAKDKLDGHTLLRSIRHAIDRTIFNERLAEREAHYRLLFEANPTPMCIVVKESGRVHSMNAAALTLYEFKDQDDLRGLCLKDLRSSSSSEEITKENITLSQGAELENHKTASGKEISVETLFKEVTYNRTRLYLMILTDVTQQLDDLRKMRLLRRCMESSSNGIIISDARQDSQPLVYVNRTFEKITGYSESEALGRNCRFLQGDEEDVDNEPALTEIRNAIDSEREVSVVLRNYRKDGTPFWNDLFISPVRDDGGTVTHHVGVLTDISERKAIENQLAYNASHDVLTHLPNRALLEDRLEQATSLAERHGRLLGLIYIDLDAFQMINDSRGYLVGDKILIEVSKRLLAIVRSGDTVARVNGDEFAVLLPALVMPNDALIAVEEVQRYLSRPFSIGGENLYLTASIGIATTDCIMPNPADLIQQADIAKNHAKQLGRNTYQWFSSDQSANTSFRVKLRNQLQDAFESDQLTVFYQPIIDPNTYRVMSVEALVRWEHPEKGLVSPGEFLPLAEETGQIVTLGKIVLFQACRAMVALQAKGFRDCTIAVNVSPIQLRKPGFVDCVQEALRSTGLKPEALELEVVESTVLQETHVVIETLHKLKDVGVKIAIDDFGTGFSSLSYIKLLPAQKIKIDQSFIKNVIKDRTDSAITQGVISMAHHLGLKVVAEGVETEAHATFLQRCHCDLLQGFFFAKPMPFDQLVESMNANEIATRLKQPSTHGTGKTILLLDDESNILRALTRVFRREKYRVLSTTSVSEAFSLLAANEVQVIISDQRMPEMSGTEFFSEVKTIYPDTVRIILSGYTDLKSVTEAINEGSIFKFLTKPWNDDQLREHVHQAFNFHSAIEA